RAKEAINPLNIKDLPSLFTLLKIHEFIKFIIKDIYFSIFQELTRHIVRIMGFFIQISKLKQSLAKEIKELQESKTLKPWEFIQYQERFVRKIMQIQDNVGYILDKKDPYEVNGFILGKFCEMDYEEAINSLKNDKSPIYFDVVERPIALENTDVVSKMSALDLLFRFQEYLSR
ncbi:MAG: hypothetical protein ACTSWN_02915, partial [Promethearchaeota archaeon]